MDAKVKRLRDLQATVTCSLCHEIFKNPHTFSTCNHTFCYDCVVATLEGPGIIVSQCPTCKQPGWKKDLAFNHTLNNIVERFNPAAAAVIAKAQRRSARRGQAQAADPQPTQVVAAAAARPAEETARPAKAPPQQQQLQQAEPSTTAGAAATAGGDSATGEHVRNRLSPFSPDAEASAKGAGGEQGVARERHQPITPCFDEFGAAWEQSMLALPPPGPEELAQLQQQALLLRRAQRLCDSLPCQQKAAAGGPRSDLAALRAEREALEGAFRRGCGAPAQRSEPTVGRPAGRGLPAPAAAAQLPLAAVTVRQQQEGTPAGRASTLAGLAGPPEDLAAMLDASQLVSRSQPLLPSLRTAKPSQFVPPTEECDVMMMVVAETGGSSGVPDSEGEPLASGLLPFAGAGPASPLPPEAAAVPPEAPAGLVIGPTPPAEPSGVKRPDVTDDTAELLPRRKPSSSTRVAERTEGQQQQQQRFGKRGRAAEQQYRSREPLAEAPTAAEADGGGGRPGGKRPRGPARQLPAAEAIARKLAKAEALAFPAPSQPSGRVDKALAVPGARVEVQWQEGPYRGTVLHLDHATGRHSIAYEDGDTASHDLDGEVWRLLDAPAEAGEEPEAAAASAVTSTAGGKKGSARQHAQAKGRRGGSRGQRAASPPGPGPSAEAAAAAAACDPTLRTLDAAGMLCQMLAGEEGDLGGAEEAQQEQQQQEQQQEEGAACASPGSRRPPLGERGRSAQNLPVGAAAQGASAGRAPSTGGGRQPMRRVVISGTPADVAKKLAKLCETLGGAKPENNVTKHTTHVLVPLGPNGEVLMRSFKYLQGVAKGGVWLLSYDWVDRCLALGDWVPEELFEARCDKSSSSRVGVPARQRLRGAEGRSGLFSGLRFLLVPERGASSGMNLMTSLAHLLELGGGATVKSLPSQPAADGGLHVVFVTSSSNEKASAKAAAVLKPKYAPHDVMKSVWILDSVSAGEVLPTRAYLV